jgi:hypothetical protein
MNQGTVTVISHDLTVPGNHKVTVSDFVTISEGYAVVARMDAEFDFSTIPAHLHTSVINNLLSNRVRLSVWSRPAQQPVLAQLAQIEPPSSPATAIARQPTKKWWQFWRNT